MKNDVDQVQRPSPVETLIMSTFYLIRYRGLLPGPGTGTYIPSKDRFGKEAILF